MTAPHNPIYVALDTPDLEYARNLAARVAPHVGGLKLGMEFLAANGPQGIKAFESFGLPIFADTKFHDIPNTVAGAVRSTAGLGVAIVNVHAAGGAAMLKAARDKGVAGGIDFNFHQIAAWQRAKEMLDGGAVGALRHVAVHWHIENRATQMRMQSWKTAGGDGGGVLGNFISHCFHYLEWFGGPLASLSARLGGLPGDHMLETTAIMTLAFASGAPASLSMSCASYLGPGHRLEFYGEDGTLVLNNVGADYMRGFELWHARRPAAALARVPVDDPADAQYPDGRIAPVSRLVKGFLDAIETGVAPKPGFAEGYRVQQLIDAAQRSHREGRLIDVRPETMERA